MILQYNPYIFEEDNIMDEFITNSIYKNILTKINIINIK
jgi:hypothetical protein